MFHMRTGKALAIWETYPQTAEMHPHLYPHISPDAGTLRCTSLH